MGVCGAGQPWSPYLPPDEGILKKGPEIIFKKKKKKNKKSNGATKRKKERS